MWAYGTWLLFTDGRTKTPSLANFKEHMRTLWKFEKLREPPVEIKGTQDVKAGNVTGQQISGNTTTSPAGK